MKKQLMLVTRDGQFHASYEDAHRHADKAYGEHLCKIANDLCGGDGKYSRMLEYLDAHSQEFILLAELKADLLVEGDPDE